MRTTMTSMLRSASAVTVLAAVVACSGQRSPPVLDPDSQVAIGYDRMHADEVTGAVSSLSGDDLDVQNVSRIEEMIRDRVPGVEVQRRPNGDYSFRIRGTRSLIGSNEPLVVIDGLPVSAQGMETALAGIAPRDVVRIDVLKDAGSTAAYGSRGANGVIMITTRVNGQY